MHMEQVLDRAVVLVQASLVEPLPAGPASAAARWPREGERPGARLIGRHLRPLAGRPVLAHVIERVRQGLTVGPVIAALSVAPQDDALVPVARAAGAEVFRGSVLDLAGRLCACADRLGLAEEQIVVRVLADCPLIDPRYLDAGVSALQAAGPAAGALEFHEERTEELCPGLGASFLRAGTLRLVDGRARTPAQRAEVMAYVLENPERAGLARAPLPEALDYLRGSHRLLLQTAEDLALHEAICLRLYQGAPVDTAGAIAFLDADPVLASLNRGVLWRGATRPMQQVGWRAR